MHVKDPEHRVRDHAADVVEIHVDSVGTGLFELALVFRNGLLDEGGIKTELFEQVFDLGIGTRDADHTAALDPGNLGGRDLFLYAISQLAQTTLVQFSER
jgi:hypothetical protein